MAPPTITAVPDVLYAKRSWIFTLGLADFPASEGWTARIDFAAAQGTGAAGDDASTNVDGRSFDFAFAPADTDKPAGTYRYQVRVTGSGTYAGQSYVAQEGYVTVAPAFEGAVAGTLQTHDEKTLAVIEAAIEGRLTADIENYTVFGRAVNKIPAEQLLKFRGIYSARVWRARHPNASLAIPVEVRMQSPE